VADLKATYRLLYPDEYIPHIPKLKFTFTDLEVLGNHFTSTKSQSKQSKAVVAKWGETMSGDSELSIKVEHFFSHTVAFCNCFEPVTTEQTGYHHCSKQRKIEHLFAKVTWFTDHTRPYHFPFPLYLVSSLTIANTVYSYIPVSRLLCRCAISERMLLEFDFGQDCGTPWTLANCTIHRPIS